MRREHVPNKLDSLPILFKQSDRQTQRYKYIHSNINKVLNIEQEYVLFVRAEMPPSVCYRNFFLSIEKGINKP